MKPLTIIALVAFVATAGCSKPSPDQLAAKGNDYLEKGMLPDATIQYRLAIQADPKRGDLRVKLGDIYMQQHDFRNALREFVTAADYLPKDVTAQIKAGNLLLMAGAFEDARTRARKAVALDKKNPDAIVLMGNALAGLKKLDNALNEYQQALALAPESDRIYANIGLIQLSRGQVKEAEATFRTAVEVAPKAVSAHMALAGFLWASRRAEEAEVELKAALALEPGNLEANRALGAFYMATGRSADAEKYFKAIAAASEADEAPLALADYYVAVQRFDEAREILTPLMAKAESFGPASLRLAAIEVHRNNRSVAVNIIRDVLNKTPKYAPARVFELRLLLMDNKLDEAMKAATALIKDEPNGAAAAEANFVIGGIEASRDRTEEAAKAYEEALRIQPQSILVSIALAQLHIRSGNADRAEAYARQVLAVQSNNPVARSFIVRVHLMRNDLTLASSELATLEKAFPQAVPVQNLVAARELAAGRLDAARAIYTKVAAVAPHDVEALQGLVIIDIQTGRKKDAIDRVEAALKRLPPSAELYVMAARTHASAGNLPRSEELLKKAIEREPTRLAAYGLLGQLYVQQNRLPDARDQFEEIVKRNPRSVPGNTMLGMLLEAQKNMPAAEAQYLKTLTVDPAAAVAANNLAWIYVTSNRNLDQALQLAQTALKSLPEETHINDTAGWVYYRKGMFPQAVRCLELSIQRDATDPAAHYHLGMAYAGEGEPDKAKKSLQKALSISSTFDGADEARKTLERLGK